MDTRERWVGVGGGGWVMGLLWWKEVGWYGWVVVWVVGGVVGQVRYRGEVECGYWYHGLVSGAGGYPVSYGYVRGRQGVEVGGIPFEVGWELTTLGRGYRGVSGYPNRVWVRLDVMGVRKILERRMGERLGVRWEERMKRQAEYERKRRLYEELEGWVRGIDTVGWMGRLDSLVRAGAIDSAGWGGMDSVEVELGRYRELLGRLDSLRREMEGLEGRVGGVGLLGGEVSDGGGVGRWLSRFRAFEVGRIGWGDRWGYVSQGLMVDGGRVGYGCDKWEVGLVVGGVNPVVIWESGGRVYTNGRRGLVGLDGRWRAGRHGFRVGSWYFRGMEGGWSGYRNVLVGLGHEVEVGRFSYLVYGVGSERGGGVVESLGVRMGGVDVYSAEAVGGGLVRDGKGYMICQVGRWRGGGRVEGVEVSYERVSPDYHSDGAPFIFRDQEKVEGWVGLKVVGKWRGRVGGFYRRDNLSMRRLVSTSWGVVYVGQQVVCGDWEVRGEYRYVDRRGVDWIRQHQGHWGVRYRGSGGVGEVGWDGVVFLGRRGIEVIDGHVVVVGRMWRGWYGRVRGGYVGVWRVGEREGGRYWQGEGEVSYEWRGGSFGVGGLLYRRVGWRSWQANGGLRVRQKLWGGIEVMGRVGYGQMREGWNWNGGVLMSQYRGYWQGELQVRYQW